MQVSVNGDKMDLPKDMTIKELLAHLNIPPDSVVVELNFEITNRNKWPTVHLKENDNVEVLKFVGGG